MPLLSLEITPAQKEALGPRTAHEFETLGLKVKESVIDGLGIPDDTDWETRRVVGDQPKASISFTIGDREYLNFPGREAFYPQEKRIQVVGDAVLREINDSPFAGANNVVMEVWGKTTFRPYEQGEMVKPEIEIPLDRKEKLGQFIENPRVRIFISPNILSEATQNKEQDKTNEGEPLGSVASEALMVIAETLGIPENVERQVEIVVTDQADTPVSFEFDCDIPPDYLIPEEIRNETVDEIEFLLRSNSTTGKYPGEIWFRQGEPALRTVSR